MTFVSNTSTTTTSQERRWVSHVINVRDRLTIPTSARNLQPSGLELPRKLPPTFWTSTSSILAHITIRHAVRDSSGSPLLSLRLSYFSLSLVSSCLARRRYSYTLRSSNLLLSRPLAFRLPTASPFLSANFAIALASKTPFNS